MFKKASLKQKGFTLIELLVAMAIAAVLLTAIVTIFRTSIHMNSNIDNQTNATNQLKNAFNYIDRDAEEAGSVVTTNPNQFLILKWIQNNIDETIIYNISNSGILQRYQYQSGALQSTMNIANYVNFDPTQTNCTWDNTNDVLTINMTVSIGTINTSRQFIITPRVVQGAISLATSIITMSATPTPSGFGQLVTFTATVTGSSGTPTGIVTFFDNGTTQLGSGNLSGGQASYPTSSLSQGSHSITAVYSGDAQYNQSTSSVWTLTVIYMAPTVTAILPISGSAAGGTSVTITGTNFVTGATTVTIGGNAATGVSVTNSTTITATTPAGTAGIASVIVTTAGGSSNAFSGYTYNNPAPTLSSISPTTGNRLQTLNVTFTGTNFISGVSSVNVGTGITVNSTTVNSSTQIVASITIGATAASSNSFSVTNGIPGGGTSVTQTFTVSNPAPTLTSISPTSGSRNTTLNVVLTGTNYISGVSSVTISGSNITINSTTVNSATQITVSITIASHASTGTRTFTVTNTGGGTSSPKNFTVN